MMNRLLLATILVSGIGANAGVAFADQEPELLEQAREIVANLDARLQQKLKTTLKKEGTAQAVEICHLAAPDIVYEANRNGWVVRRTSLKVRNLEDAPDKWESKILEELEAKNEADAPESEMEHWEIVTVDGQKRFRYMKAIVAKQVCTRCHGTHIDKQVAKQLDSLYPFDQARGFEAGDLRGAYSLSKVVPTR